MCSRLLVISFFKSLNHQNFSMPFSLMGFLTSRRFIVFSFNGILLFMTLRVYSSFRFLSFSPLPSIRLPAFLSSYFLVFMTTRLLIDVYSSVLVSLCTVVTVFLNCCLCFYLLAFSASILLAVSVLLSFKLLVF